MMDMPKISLFLRGAIGGLCLAIAAPALAEKPPIPSKDVSITARNSDVSDFLKQLFAETGLRAKVSASIGRQKINGRFQGNAQAIWGQVSRAFNLVGFYDKSVVRIYSSSEIQTRNFDDVDGARLVSDVQRMGLTDQYNSVKTDGRMVIASGVPAFLEQVGAMASRAKMSSVANPPVTPAAYEKPIVSPLAYKVRSQVMVPASKRSPYEVRIFFLRYAQANDTFTRTGDRESRNPGLASILSGIMGDGRSSATVRTSGDDVDVFNRPPPSDYGILDGGINILSPPAALDEDEKVKPDLRDVNGPRIEVDQTQNAVIVRDRPQAMKVYEGIISSLDLPPRMVEIEAAIIDLNIDRLKDLGIDFNLQIDGLNVLFGGVSANPVPGFSAPNAQGEYVTGSGDIFGARITALERRGALSIVSRPQLTTMDNRAALFSNSQEIYVEVEGRFGRLERIEIGTVLRVTPAIVREGDQTRVQLQIDIEDGSPTQSGVNGLPVLKRSRVTSQAIVNQGESVLLGGLTVDSTFDFKSKTPVLGDIPLFGNVFKKRRKGSSRIERLFLITPRVVGQGGPSRMTSTSRRAPIPLEQLQGKTKKERRNR
ncbi:type III secretion system outer membrane ring subunit SctC [Parasphingorhabdus cellanae]|uniref:Type 3 secretion system secretin n=1 Tax=Parasphingorhabdus cellanae TaxID=2806553 RepID=A0ABX7T5C8_9SPHN|nr:type III secretion system outer membrane ring subunit SctC [Parasphingorhabdus cellanae]QTD56133.1 type III secretion system outer membrane ring subunit SctC [Parasphingorhabdus cellanae]